MTRKFIARHALGERVRGEALVAHDSVFMKSSTRDKVEGGFKEV